MKVELMNYTPDALTLLLKTKGTRLKHEDDPATWDEARRREHLDYMRDTIKSSWEFCDFTFKISGVTRAFTHQLVRTRSGHYAQQAMRVIDAREHEVVTPEFLADVEAVSLDNNYDAQQKSLRTLSGIWHAATNAVIGAYGRMIDAGMPAQDARGILPTNITTEIIAKFDLRTLHEMAKLRLCTRTQGEYQRVFRLMRERVIAVYPWAAPFIDVHCVATGTCAFPRYGKVECKFYDPRMDQTVLKQEVAIKFWSATEIQEARPVAKSGMAM